jgi:hypothetical protein
MILDGFLQEVRGNPQIIAIIFFRSSGKQIPGMTPGKARGGLTKNVSQ